MKCSIHSAVQTFLSEHLSARAERIVCAFSGGMDSTVLLHALSQLTLPNHVRLIAAHIDHGLQADSAHWAECCARFADSCRVSFERHRVTLTEVDQYGPEAAARRARYDALEALLGGDDLLLTAHHLDDQAETFLLRALRSAGVEGLAAIRPLRALGRGALGRPLLALPRSSILAYANRHQLQWIEDPSNQRDDADRNFLRLRVLPLLQQRWPQAARALGESARHLRSAHQMLLPSLEVQVSDLSGENKTRLRISKLLQHSDDVCLTLLRHWLQSRAQVPPSTRVLDDLLQQLRKAKADRNIRICWADAELRRYRDELQLLPTQSPISQHETHWDLQQPLSLSDGRTLRIDGQVAVRNASVRSRQDGLSIAVAANRPRRPLRLLFQESGLPPWVRERLPYLFIDDNLMAVGDQWLDHSFRDWLDAHHASLIFIDLQETKSMTTTVQHQADQRQFQMDVDGHRCHIDYTLHDKVMTTTHTIVPEAVGGRGLAGQLTEAALQHARAAGWKVDPQCSYTARYMDRHPEYSDLRVQA